MPLWDTYTSNFRKVYSFSAPMPHPCTDGMKSHGQHLSTKLKSLTKQKLLSQDGRHWCQGEVTVFRDLWLVSTDSITSLWLVRLQVA